MTKIRWADLTDRRFLAGVDQGVLYLQNGTGVAWNGLLSVVESPSEGALVESFQDGVKTDARRRGDSFAFTVEALAYPLEFEGHIGIQSSLTRQDPIPAGFSYRSAIRSAEDGSEVGHYIHVVYNATFIAGGVSQTTLNSDVELSKFSWDCTTRSEVFGDYVGSHLMIDTTKTPTQVLDKVEALLYGTPGDPPRLPSPQEIVNLFEEGSTLFITDNGDGTWTAEGPDDIIKDIASGVFSIQWNSAVYLDGESFIVSTL